MVKELSSEDQEQLNFAELVGQAELVLRSIWPDQHVGWDLVRRRGTVLVELRLRCSLVLNLEAVVEEVEKNRSCVGVVYRMRIVVGEVVDDHFVDMVDMATHVLLQQEGDLDCERTLVVDNVEMEVSRRGTVAMDILVPDMGMVEDLLRAVIVAYGEVIACMGSAALVSV